MERFGPWVVWIGNVVARIKLSVEATPELLNGAGGMKSVEIEKLPNRILLSLDGGGNSF
jgi:hypothetical protein